MPTPSIRPAVVASSPYFKSRSTFSVIVSAGLGVDIARTLAGRGVNLALVARSKDALEENRKRFQALGVKVLAVSADICDRATLERAVTRVTDELGAIDILVNNAGMERMASFETLTLEEIEEVIQVNLSAPQPSARGLLTIPEYMNSGKRNML